MSWFACCGSSRKDADGSGKEMMASDGHEGAWHTTNPPYLPQDDHNRQVMRSSGTLSPRRLLELTKAMDDIELEEALTQVPLFSTLKPSEISSLAKGLEHLVLSEGEFAYRQGEVGDTFFIIISGQIEKVVESAAGSNKPDIVVGKPLGPGTYFGQMALVNKDERRSCSMRARERTELRFIRRSGFRKLVGDLSSILKRNTSKFEAYESYIKEARRASQVEAHGEGSFPAPDAWL